MHGPQGHGELRVSSWKKVKELLQHDDKSASRVCAIQHTPDRNKQRIGVFVLKLRESFKSYLNGPENWQSSYYIQEQVHAVPLSDMMTLA